MARDQQIKNRKMTRYREATQVPAGIFRGKRVACVGPAEHDDALVESYDLVMRFNNHWENATGRTDILYINSERLYKAPLAAGIKHIVHRPGDLHQQSRVRFRVGMLIGLLGALDAHRRGAAEVLLAGMDVYVNGVTAPGFTKGLVHGAPRESHLDVIFLMDTLIPEITLDERLRKIIEEHKKTPNFQWTITPSK